MPLMDTSNATILCMHGGMVQLIPKQTQVTISGGSVMCEGDLRGSRIVGCAQPPRPGTKPCTMVVSTLPGSTLLTVMVGGRPAYTQVLQGLTDGVPSGTLMVADPGQALVNG